ncbi:hypothetical protein FOA43_001137 [Brettanomyces nanus]|uniref:Hpc2-related domain-containing protein n=1 Tax=Eeniella nana TaxID=13502 RepID=A0A875RYV6_EENNA|nr:uncharacterized protein FOA43_001137 [Brettanomyces nanus]QPG73823.1 hypothetical protein FOA43_001137 [Brettanomyces nanus]
MRDKTISIYSLLSEGNEDATKEENASVASVSTRLEDIKPNEANIGLTLSSPSPPEEFSQNHQESPTTLYDPITNTIRDLVDESVSESIKISAKESSRRLKMSLSEMMNAPAQIQPSDSEVIIGSVALASGQTPAETKPESTPLKPSTRPSSASESTPLKPSAKPSSASESTLLKPNTKPSSASESAPLKLSIKSTSASKSPTKTDSRFSPRKSRRALKLVKKGSGGLLRTTSGAGLIKQGSSLDGSETDVLEEDADPVDASKRKEPQLPIICVDVPIARPGSKFNESKVTFNVTSICEDKYGFNALNPGNRFALDLDDDVEDDDAGDDDDIGVNATSSTTAGVAGASRPGTESGILAGADDDYENADDIVRQLNLKFEPGMNDEEKEDLVLKELHRRRMEDNKRIGKYNVEDPFIDDEELQFEEQTKNNKDGFFVYYGPWIEPETFKGKRRMAAGVASKRRRIPAGPNVIAIHSPSPSRSVSARSNTSRSNSDKSRHHESDPDRGKSEKPRTEPKEASKIIVGKPVIVGSKPVIATDSTNDNKIIIGSLPVL